MKIASALWRAAYGSEIPWYIERKNGRNTEILLLQSTTEITPEES